MRILFLKSVIESEITSDSQLSREKRLVLCHCAQWAQPTSNEGLTEHSNKELIEKVLISMINVLIAIRNEKKLSALSSRFRPRLNARRHIQIENDLQLNSEQSLTKNAENKLTFVSKLQYHVNCCDTISKQISCNWLQYFSIKSNNGAKKGLGIRNLFAILKR